MKRILVIGGGGIGSFLLRELYRLMMNDQIDLDEVDIDIADDDAVELKNIRYQDFTKDDLLKNKARVLAERYGFRAIPHRITEAKHLEPYVLIILAVDNILTRRMVYEYGYVSNTEFIDLRAEGRSIAAFTKPGNTQEDLMKTLEASEVENGRSCQLQYELEKGIIQNGNVIVATVGSQMTLNFLRGESNPPRLNWRI